LKPYPALARAWDLPEFAGQNAVNGTLHALTWMHVQQIEQVFQFLFEHNSLALRQSRQEPLVVDIDTKGLPVSPRSRRFEWAERGYFPRERNQKGLQFSAAFIGAGFREVLGGHLAPGYAHVTHNLPAILQLIEKRLGPPPRRGDLLHQRACLLQTEAKAYTQRAATAEQSIQHCYGQRHTCQIRITQHQAQIQALKARMQRLPKRGRKLKQQITAHQDQIRHARGREKRHQQHIERWQQRAGQARQEAELLREGSHNLIALAETPVAIGQVRLIVLRADSGLGNGETITVLLERGYLVVVKGRDARTARKLAAAILTPEWLRVDAHLRAAEAKSTRVTGCPFDVRLVVCERTADRGRVNYYVLVTNLPISTYGTVALVAFYNARQTIEAFNKVIGNVLYLDHLRTGSITANEAVAQLAMLGHDFMSWSTHRFFAGTPYAGMAIRELVQKGLHVLARVSWPQPNICRTELALDNPYAHAFVAGPQGANGQMPIPLDFGPKSTPPRTV
jgi:Transposase DDE domain group 1